MADGSVAYGSLPFKEQIAFFRAKTNVTTEHWTDVWQEEHDHAFMVAGANRIDLLVDLRQAVDRAIADGGTLEQFRKDFDQVVAKYGWDYNGGRNWRTRVIYETNLRTSYAAGRWQQLQAVKLARPFWEYVHSDSVQHPRPQHLAWNGLVLHADDPWWQTHFPPNGWGCQCSVRARNQRDLTRMGKNGPDQAPASDMQEVLVGKNGPMPQTIETPAGVDPGFGYAPGRSAFEQLAQNTLTKSAQLSAEAAAEALEPLLHLPRMQQALAAGYDAFQASVLDAGSARGLSVPVGALDAQLVDAMAQAGAQPAFAAIAAGDAEVLQALRGALSPAALAALPGVLANPRAVLLDKVNRTLLYVAAAPADTSGTTTVIAVTYRLATARTSAVNSFRSAAAVDLADLRADLVDGRVELLRGTLD